MFQSTNEYKGKKVTQNLGDVVINQHQDMSVKFCLTDIQLTKSHSDMEMRQCKYYFSILIDLWGKIGHKSGLVLGYMVLG